MSIESSVGLRCDSHKGTVYVAAETASNLSAPVHLCLARASRISGQQDRVPFPFLLKKFDNLDSKIGSV